MGFELPQAAGKTGGHDAQIVKLSVNPKFDDVCSAVHGHIISSLFK